MRLVLQLAPPESRHYRSWGERVSAVSRFSRPAEVHALCEEAHAVGARAVLAVPDPAILAALTEVQRWRDDVEVWAVVPNMFAFIRDLTDLGAAGAARARFLRLGPGEMVRVVLAAMSKAGRVLRQDFATGALLVAEMERLALRGLRVTRLFLHPQLTEIALAGAVVPLFTGLLNHAVDLGLAAGLMTHNPVRAAAVLGSDFDRFSAVIAPCNAKGYKMFPGREACEALFRSHPARFLAAEVSAGGTLSAERGLAHVRSLGLGGALLDAPLTTALFRAAS